VRDPRLIEFAKQMRREMTAAEKRLWFEIRAKKFLDIKFRAQKVVGRYITDFASRNPMLVIELDGDTHVGRELYDAARTEYLNEQGYEVIRFLNSDVLENLEGVLEVLVTHLQPPPLPTLSPEGERAL
jgi:very-short-patch-repair endonuclease